MIIWMILLGALVYYFIGFMIGAFILCKELWYLNLDRTDDLFLCLGIIALLWPIFLVMSLFIYLSTHIMSSLMYLVKKCHLPSPIELIRRCRERNRKKKYRKETS